MGLPGFLLMTAVEGLARVGEWLLALWRSFCGRITGNALLHWLLGVVYLSAFLSLYLQWDGLLSYNGLEPVDLFVSRVRAHFLRGHNQLAAQESLHTTGLHLLQRFGSLAVLAPELGMTADGICELLMLVGLCSAALIVAGLPLRALFAVCWLCYMSLQHVGQTWLSFQWDILLLEAGFLAIFSSPTVPQWIMDGGLARARANVPVLWCFRFLAWKLMFLSGLVKLQARCPTWENLTALEYHFATQCLPTPLAWFAHQLPPLVLRASVAATLVLEIPLSFFLLSPFRRARRIGAGMQMAFQLSIMLTGNYTFFNILTAALMVAAWIDDDQPDDGTADKGADDDMPGKRGASLVGPFFYLDLIRLADATALGQSAVSALTHMTCIFACVGMVSYAPHSAGRHVGYWSGEDLVLRVRWDDLAPLLPAASRAAVYWAVGHAGAYGARDAARRVHAAPRLGLGPSRRSLAVLALRLARALGSIAFAACWILVSATALSAVTDVSFVPAAMKRLDKATRAFSLVSSYGLFRRMTGVSERQGAGRVGRFVPSMVARPEIILQGLHPATQQWLDISFRHKPGSLHARPTVVAPLQPRLDWQMWFAALGPPNQQPWLLHLVHRLLHDAHHSSPVAALLGSGNLTWGEGRADRPAAIRAVLYEYDFTRWNTSWARAVPEAFLIPLPEARHEAFNGVGEFLFARRRGNASAASRRNEEEEERGKTCPASDDARCSLPLVPPTHPWDKAWYGRRNPQEYLPALDRNQPTLADFLRGAGLEPARALEPPLSATQLHAACLERAGASGLSRAACGALLLRPRVVGMLTRDVSTPLALLALVALLINRKTFVAQP